MTRQKDIPRPPRDGVRCPTTLPEGGRIAALAHSHPPTFRMKAVTWPDREVWLQRAIRTAQLSQKYDTRASDEPAGRRA